MKVFLQTERLTLREFESFDVDNLVALDSDPEVMRYLTGGAPTPREAIESSILPGFLNAYEKFGGLGFWAALDRANGDFLGWFGLHPNDSGPSDLLELGYRLRREIMGSRASQPKGARALVDVGFGEFGASRIFAQTYEENVASRRVMEKIGMSFVRAFRITTPEQLAAGTFVPDEAAMFDGDDVEYAIERREWTGRANFATKTEPVS